MVADGEETSVPWSHDPPPVAPGQHPLFGPQTPHARATERTRNIDVTRPTRWWAGKVDMTLASVIVRNLEAKATIVDRIGAVVHEREETRLTPVRGMGFELHAKGPKREVTVVQQHST